MLPVAPVSRRIGSSRIALRTSRARIFTSADGPSVIAFRKAGSATDLICRIAALAA
jgi:hypothetical protein